MGIALDMTASSAGIARPSSRLRAWRWLLPFALVAVMLRLLPAPGLPVTDTDGNARIAPVSAPLPAIDPNDPTVRDVLERSGATVTSTDALPPEWRGSKHILPLDIGPAAAPYAVAGRTAQDRGRALSCLANAIYYEAGNEPEEGQRAVAQVVLNRMRHAEWPNSVCGVVYQGTERTDLGCQFTFSCDGAMARVPDRARWMRAFQIAGEALAGQKSFAPAGLATFYHTLAVRPAWSARLTPVAIIGAHIFYRMPGNNSDPIRYRDSYAGTETIAGPSINAFVRPQPTTLPDLPVETAFTSGGPALLPTGVVSMASPASPAVAVLPTSTSNWPRNPPLHADLQAGALDPGKVRLPVSGVKPEYQSSGRTLD